MDLAEGLAAGSGFRTDLGTQLRSAAGFKQTIVLLASEDIHHVHPPGIGYFDRRDRAEKERGMSEDTKEMCTVLRYASGFILRVYITTSQS